MQTRNRSEMSRRTCAGSLGTSIVFAPSLLKVDTAEAVPRNVSSFRTHALEYHFDRPGVGEIILDTSAKGLQHGTADGEMRLEPKIVLMSEELTRHGYTEVIEKRNNPRWAPMPSMRERNPEWPERIPGGDPANPLGTQVKLI